MKLIIANRDRSADIGTDMGDAAKARATRAPRMLSPQHSALRLKEAGTEREYLDRFVALVRLRRGVSTADFEVPRKPGIVGAILARVRMFLWKLLRYQHDHTMFQQNLINELLGDALEFERERSRREMKELRERLEALESGKAGR
jgi:hypothetical protein